MTQCLQFSNAFCAGETPYMCQNMACVASVSDCYINYSDVPPI